jgi:hypothetical protein
MVLLPQPYAYWHHSQSKWLRLKNYNLIFFNSNPFFFSISNDSVHDLMDFFQLMDNPIARLLPRLVNDILSFLGVEACSIPQIDGHESMEHQHLRYMKRRFVAYETNLWNIYFLLLYFMCM